MEKPSIEKKIIQFFKNGGQYDEEEIDFGEDVGREFKEEPNADSKYSSDRSDVNNKKE